MAGGTRFSVSIDFSGKTLKMLGFWTILDKASNFESHSSCAAAACFTENRAARSGLRCETASRPVQCLHGQWNRVT